MTSMMHMPWVIVVLMVLLLLVAGALYVTFRVMGVSSDHRDHPRGRR